MTFTLAPVSFSKSGARRCIGSAICGPVKVMTLTVTPSNSPAEAGASCASVSAVQAKNARLAKRELTIGSSLVLFVCLIRLAPAFVTALSMFAGASSKLIRRSSHFLVGEDLRVGLRKRFELDHHGLDMGKHRRAGCFGVAGLDGVDDRHMLLIGDDVAAR